MSEPNDPVASRSKFLTMLMATLAAGFFVLVMILLTGGFFFYVVGVGIGLVLVGMLHYAVWGQRMEREVSAERQQLEMLDRMKEDLDRGGHWTARR